MNQVFPPTSDAVVASDAPDDADPARRAERSRGSLAALWCVVFLVRWAYAADRRVYHLAPDEPATLGMARWLSGAGDWTMMQAATWRPGLSSVIAPLFWFTDDPETLYRAALVVNAAIGAAAAVLLVGIVRRLCGWSSTTALVVSGVIAVLPASLSASGYVWAEPLVTLTFLGATSAVLRYWDAGSLSAGLIAIGAAAAGMVSHGRMMPFVVLVGVAVVWRAIERRHLVHAVTLVGATAVGGGLAAAYTSFVIDGVWTNPATTNTAGATLRRLGRPLAIAESAAGQVWYLLAASVGVFGVGCYVLARRAFGRAAPPTARRDARVLLFLTLPLIAVSIVFVTDRPRVDQLVYGRYNDAIVWPMLAVGVAWLLDGVRRESRRTVGWIGGVVVVLLVELGLLVRQLHSTRLADDRPEYAMIAGVQAFAGSPDRFPLLQVTLLAAVVSVAVLVAARWERGGTRLLVVLLGAVVLAGAIASRDLGDRRNTGENAAAVGVVEDGLVPPDEELGARFTPVALAPNVSPRAQLDHVLLFQWYLPDRTFVEDFGNDDDVGPYVFAPSNDALMEVTGGTIVWADPASNMVLWREPADG